MTEAGATENAASSGEGVTYKDEFGSTKSPGTPKSDVFSDEQDDRPLLGVGKFGEATTNKILFPIFLYLFAIKLFAPVVPAYLVDVVKHHRGYDIEEELSDDIEADISGEAAMWDMILRLSLSIFAFIIIAPYGGYSDYKGRTYVLVLCSALNTAAAIAWTICVYLKTPLIYLFIPNVITGLSGHWPVMLMVVFSYSADVSTRDDKSTNFGFVEAALYLGEFVGPIAGGYLYEYTNHWVPFLMSTVISGLLTLYFFLLPESLPKHSRTTKLNVKKLNPLRVVWILFETKPRSLLALVFVFGYGLHGIKEIMTFYTMYKFKWTSADTGQFSSVLYLYRAATVGLFIPFAKWAFKPAWLPMFVTRIGLVGYVASMTLFIFVEIDWAYYLIAILFGLGATVVVSMRTMFSNAVAHNRQAMALSAIGTAEALMNIFLGPSYEYLYSKTVQWFPGISFVIAATLSLIAFVTSWFVKRENIGDAKTVYSSLKSSEAPHYGSVNAREFDGV